MRTSWCLQLVDFSTSSVLQPILQTKGDLLSANADTAVLALADIDCRHEGQQTRCALSYVCFVPRLIQAHTVFVHLPDLLDSHMPPVCIHQLPGPGTFSHDSYAGQQREAIAVCGL
jgi:hypothetical protein